MASSRHELTAALRGVFDQVATAVEQALVDESAIPEARRLARVLENAARGSQLPPLAQRAAALCALFDGALIAERVRVALAGVSYELERAARTRQSTAAMPALALAHRVLVIDPSAESGAELAEQIRAQLVDVTVVPTIDAAIVEARRRRPDAVFLDAALESADRNDGRRLAREPALKDVPVAILANDGFATHRAAVAQIGVSLYLERPLAPESVGLALRRLIDASRVITPKVVVLDDDQDYLRITERLLRGDGFEVRTESQAEQILETLEEVRPDVLLVDGSMPELSGYDVCRILRTSADWQDLPIVFLTGRTDIDSRLAAFRAGADDFVAKSAPYEELLARVRGRVERTRALRERGDRDFLTGLARRGAFLASFLPMLNLARRRERPIALAILDLDKFKDVNDRYGHLAGDRVLVALGKLVTAGFRGEDLRGRWGGEELVVAFPDEDAATAAPPIERLRDDLTAIAFEEDGETFHVSLSAGVATFPVDGTSPAELFAAADRRLYVAKRLGRARVISEG